MNPGTSGRAIVAVGAAAIAIATLTPGSDYGYGGSALCLVCGELGGVDVFQNTLLFMPLGAGLALVRARATSALVLMMSGTLAIELLQFRMVPGRDASAGDVLTNLLGGAIGFLLARHRHALVRPARRGAAWLGVVWTLVFLAVQLVAAWTLVPAPTPLPYYGQIARDLGPGLTGFPGRVLHPMIGQDTILDWGFTPAHVRELLSQPAGAIVSASVVPSACPTTLAGIIHVADGRQREVLILGQRDADLVYGLRTHAEALRLRPRRYRLANVFGEKGDCRVTDGEIALRARLSRSIVELRADRPDTTIARDFAPDIGDSWRLLTPWQTYADGSVRSGLLTLLWIAGLVAPLSFWSAATHLGAGARTRTTILMAWLALIIVVGLVGIPRAFGLPAPGEWAAVGAIVGAAVGLALRVHLRRP